MSSPEEPTPSVEPAANAACEQLALQDKPLTAKELEILRWATEGKTVWEISRIRCVSQATVKFHLRNIYCKLHVNNRVQAVSEAIKRGLCN
ncbi:MULTISPECIES: response regulator transcription factor [Pseudomonas]|uniref:Helix-turn-helix transcriptional regulator n=1 Tax=Pseudomonas gessardii TaxID=78544 RepID=A0A7Y1MSL9_9PSED|nr:MULTISPECIES: helix-turn-helix transcriptional regulator [Pseudomonas]MBH3425998.1 helix-turn-helix transcriptional regulator [Pseudomonas gessardii]MCF4977878.1 LuxR family transcriptional regulator [Pseudomonas gessardii]MCF4988984.1 LuxR family transcriptional regulator [Pseudomonas gessardii]MCF5084834.1 LuxR family transcriptional regulator [Pseudomonas gessardii]MCF5093929.1 LuxR family transcriptional regulator [Pseudomonas gessardii]